MCTYIHIYKKNSHICLHVLGQIWTQRLFPQLLHKRTHTHAHTHFSLSLSLSMATKGADIYSVFWQPVDGAGESTQMFEMWNSADSEV